MSNGGMKRLGYHIREVNIYQKLNVFGEQSLSLQIQSIMID